MNAASLDNPERPNDPEIITSPRNSLAYEKIGSKDHIIRHPLGKVRIITYPTPSSAQIELRNRLNHQGLILGTPITDSDEAEQAYRIPLSSRPVAYDASVAYTGAFSYSDEQMFYDIGDILAKLLYSHPDKPVIDGDIGRCVVLEEFVQPGARAIYLTPGIERILVPSDNLTDPKSHYVDKLHDKLGPRFDVAQVYFDMGFSDSLAA